MANVCISGIRILNLLFVRPGVCFWLLFNICPGKWYELSSYARKVKALNFVPLFVSCRLIQEKHKTKSQVTIITSLEFLPADHLNAVTSHEQNLFCFILKCQPFKMSSTVHKETLFNSHGQSCLNIISQDLLIKHLTKQLKNKQISNYLEILIMRYYSNTHLFSVNITFNWGTMPRLAIFLKWLLRQILHFAFVGQDTLMPFYEGNPINVQCCVHT